MAIPVSSVSLPKKFLERRWKSRLFLEPNSVSLEHQVITSVTHPGFSHLLSIYPKNGWHPSIRNELLRSAWAFCDLIMPRDEFGPAPAIRDGSMAVELGLCINVGSMATTCNEVKNEIRYKKT